MDLDWWEKNWRWIFIVLALLAIVGLPALGVLSSGLGVLWVMTAFGYLLFGFFIWAAIFDSIDMPPPFLKIVLLWLPMVASEKFRNWIMGDS